LVTNKIHPDSFLKEDPLFKIIEVSNGKFSLGQFISNREKHPLRYYYGYFRNSYFIFREAILLAIKYNVDILHGTGIEFGIASILLKKYSKKIPPVIWEVQAANFTYNSYSGSFAQRIYKVIQREIFKRVIGTEIKAFAVLGEYQKKEQKKQLQLKDNFFIEVIREGGDGPRQIADKAVARKKIGLNAYKDKTIFLFFGLLRKEKGIGFLLRSIPYIKSNNFLVVIAGSPIHYKAEEIHNLVKELGIEDKVILRLEYIPDNEISDYYFACDALVLPYIKKYTGGSGPLFNEGACVHSKPCIVSDVSEMGHVVKKYNLGLVFEPENPQSIAEKLGYFIRLPESEKQKLSDNAFNFAKRNTWEVRAIRYSELYKKCYKN
jgi:glycosyltransferase involved in cell wall biosynthesis